MLILLVRPKPHRETIGLQSVMICEPLELMTIKSVLLNNYHKVIIIDMIVERKPLLYFIKKHKPDLIGFTGYISHVNVIKRYAKIAKDFDSSIQTVVGGVHGEVCPWDFADENIDKIFASASDLYEFLQCENKEALLPDRQLPQRYRKKYYYLFHKDCALLKTSLGCPYNCTFCFCKEISPYYARPVDDVISELLTISQQEVYIVDDDFLFSRARLLEFAEKLQENHIKKNFLVYGRADFIAKNEDVIKTLRESGLKAVIVGIESASQQELNAYNKNTKIEENIKAVNILQKYGIECYATVILGMDWNKSNFDTLYYFLKALKLVFVNLQPFTPMPGTPYFDECKDKLIIGYGEHEKWDMAHIVTKPGLLTPRQYYFQIIKLYYKLTFSPKSVLYMINKYGFLSTLKLGFGSMHVNFQYIGKMLKG